MKKIGILTCSLFLGILYAESGMSQNLSSTYSTSGKTIYLAAVNQKDTPGKTSEANQTAKTKIGAGEETETKICYKPTDSGSSYEGKIKALKSAPELDRRKQCNTTYTDCKDSCFTSLSKSETLKAEALKRRKLKTR